MAMRRASRALLASLAVMIVLAAALGGALYGAMEETGNALSRASDAETMLAAAREELAVALEDRTEALSQAESLRDTASASESLSAQLRIALEANAVQEKEILRLTSLSESREKRASLLSQTNDQLRETIDATRSKYLTADAERTRLGAVLTEREERLAGVEALYSETTRKLKEEQAFRLRETERAETSEAELRTVYALLTQAEEAYAGASALLNESEMQIDDARRLALSKASEAAAAEQAARVKQEELDRAESQLQETRAALETARQELAQYASGSAFENASASGDPSALANASASGDPSALANDSASGDPLDGGLLTDSANIENAVIGKRILLPSTKKPASLPSMYSRRSD